MPPAQSPVAGTLRLGLVLAVLVGINLYVFLWRGQTSIPEVMEQAAMAGKDNPTRTEKPGGTDKGGNGTASNAGDDAGSAADAAPVADAQPDAKPEPRDRWVDGTVKSGDSLGRILRREKLTPPEADEVIRALRDHMDFRKIRPGQDYRIRFDPDGKLMEFEFQISRTQTVRAVRNDEGDLIGKKDETRTDLRLEEVGGRVDSSLYAAIKRQGEDTSLVSFFVDVFAYDMNFFTETQKGDTFRMLIEKEYVGDEFLGYKRILAAEYSGKAGTYRALYWQQPGADSGRYFDEQGRSVEKSLLKTPLKFSRISSKFNPSRMHPVLHKKRKHLGVDYAAPTGTPIWAAASGKIIYRGWRGGAGNCVILQHENGLQTVYMHMSKFRKGQKVGQRVKSKTVIGYVGKTGLATGPHLHFGVKKNGRYVDPLKLEPSRRGGVPKKHRKRFRKDADALLDRLGKIALPGQS